MRAPDGTRWGTVHEAARELRVNPDTIYKWARRNHVRHHKLGVMWVCIDDVADRELKWRNRVTGTEPNGDTAA